MKSIFVILILLTSSFVYGVEVPDAPASVDGIVAGLSSPLDKLTLNDASGVDFSELVQALERIEDLLVYVIVVGSLSCGLFLWRLAILSISRRNLF